MGNSNKNKNNKSIDEDKSVKRRKTRRIKKDKYKKVKNENFSLISQKIGEKLKIENINEYNQYGDTKKYKNSFLVIETIIYNLNMFKNNAYSNLENYYKIDDFNIIFDKNEYIKNKIKTYVIEYFNDEQFISENKTKYDDSEIIISSNEININLEKYNKNAKNGKNLENGIPVNELKIGKKIKLENNSNANKVKKIIEKIENGSILKKLLKLKGKNNNMNYYFCLNCYEYLENNNINNNNNINDEHFYLDINDYKEIEYELDYDSKLNKIYNIFKKNKKRF